MKSHVRLRENYNYFGVSYDENSGEFLINEMFMELPNHLNIQILESRMESRKLPTPTRSYLVNAFTSQPNQHFTIIINRTHIPAPF